MFANRDAIGLRIKALRKAHSLTGKDLAQLLGCTQGFISKIENGKIKPSSELIQLLCNKLGIDRKTQQELLAVTKAFLLSFDRWSQQDSSFAQLQEAVLKRELSAHTIQSFQWNLLGGLLQTKEYARAVFQVQGAGISDQEIEDAVRVRLRRQSLALRSQKQIQLIQSENSLGNWFADPAQKAPQLEKLKQIIQNGDIQLRILPLRIQLSVLPVSSFVIYEPSLVEVETQTMCLHFWENRELDTYRKLFATLMEQSVGGEKALRIIDKYL